MARYSGSRYLASLFLGSTLAAGAAYAQPITLGAISGETETLVSTESPLSMMGTRLAGYVLVENLAYEKEVLVHYSYDKETWHQVEAFYDETLESGLEKWVFETPLVTLPEGSNVGHTYEVGFSYAVKGDSFGLDKNLCVSAGPRGVCPNVISNEKE